MRLRLLNSLTVIPGYPCLKTTIDAIEDLNLFRGPQIIEILVIAFVNLCYELFLNLCFGPMTAHLTRELSNVSIAPLRSTLRATIAFRGARLFIFDLLRMLRLRFTCFGFGFRLSIWLS